MGLQSLLWVASATSLLVTLTPPIEAFTPPGQASQLLCQKASFIVQHDMEEEIKTVESSSRRSLIHSTLTLGTAGGTFFVPTQTAFAGIDVNALKNLPVEGDTSGAATRLKQLEAIKVQPEDLVDIPYVKLDSGVSYREYRSGKGDAAVQPGSKVGAEMTIRCKSFATANEPGGLKYFSTKEDTEFNELAWTVGSGVLSPALEEGMMGMRKNAIRRIEVPSTLVYAAKKADQLPLPQTKDGKRRFENLFKTDATLLVEVLVTRIK